MPFLFSRHVLPDKFCSLCEEHPEDTIHCLWLCDGVKSIWLLDPIFSSLRSKVFRSFGDLIAAVLADTSPNFAALFSMVAWCIWVRRNKLREKQPVWDVGETVRRARELLQEFRDVQVRPSRTSVQRMRQKWMPPGLGVYKLNFDGGIFEGSARAGSGVVVRDAEGMIIAALSQNIQLPSSVDLVEALAARRAILFAQELCLAHVVVEGDSLKVITAINNPQKNRTQWDHDIEDIKKASSWFQICSPLLARIAVKTAVGQKNYHRTCLMYFSLIYLNKIDLPVLQKQKKNVQ